MILTGYQESARLYGTHLLRTFIRVGVDDFAGWGVELLLGQLSDESRVVSLAALDVLDEVCDNEVSKTSAINIVLFLFCKGTY